MIFSTPIRIARRTLMAAAWLLFWGVAGMAGAEESRFLVRTWQSEHGLPSNLVRSLAEAADGYLWVATAEGLARFDGNRFSGFASEADDALARLSPRFVHAQPNGDVWVSTTHGGLLRWHGGHFQVVWKDAESNGTRVPQVLQFLSDGAQALFLTRSDELWRMEGDEAPRQVTMTPAIAERLRLARLGYRQPTGAGAHEAQLKDRAERLWSVDALSGLSVTLPGGAHESISLPILQPTNRITQLFEDREGNVWAATGEIGLVQVRPRRVEMLTVAEGLHDHSVGTVFGDRSGALWIAGKGGGIDRWAAGVATHFHVGDGDAASRPVCALCQDRNGLLWAATRNGSVFQFVGSGFHRVFDRPGDPSKVEAIVEDHEGGLWLGGAHGLALWKDARLENFGPEQGLPARGLTGLAVDAAGALWIATERGELFCKKGARIERVGASEARSRFPISALYPDGDGSLWGATLGGGLFHWHEGRFSRFGAAEGLIEERITGLVEDAAGYLWLGSLRGIFRVSKTELAEIERSERRVASWLQLDRSDGLLTHECTGFAQPNAWRSRDDGSLWFATSNGVAHIRPEQVLLNPVAPPVYIEEFGTNGSPLAWLNGAPIVAGPGRSRLEFAFTGVSFAAPEKVRFRFRLEGLEKEWRDAGTQRAAVYEAVPSGHYVFHVLAANSDGVWNELGQTLPLEVLPRFWETGWFLLVSVILASSVPGAIGWAIARQRMRKRMARLELQRAREAERARIARDLHDDLGARLTEISLLATLSGEAPTTADSRGSLTEIGGKAQALLGTLDEIVWAINPRHDTLASLVDYLPAFAAEYLEAAGISLRLDVARALPPIALNAERRHGLFLALREALHNAVKHSGAREMWLRLRIEGNRVRLIIEDGGRGFEESSVHGGDGLRNLRERLASLGGQCVIDSAPGRGTRVELSVPMGDD